MVFKLKYLKYGLPILLLIFLIFLVKAKNQPACTITPAILNTSDVNNSTVNLTWTNGQNSKINYLNISTNNSLKTDGSLSEADIANDVVTDKDSYSKSDLASGTYYWNIVSDGCKQRKISKLGSFTVEPVAIESCNLAAATLDTPLVKDSKVTFNWTADKNTKAAYINISTSDIVNTDGILQKVDIANDIVSNITSFTRENLSSGTYYWNIAADGCGQRRISEIGSFTIQ